jgi:two-component system cell cycle sensor histidine kinase/response regulator CckA
VATILVVDDRPENRQFLLTLLGYRGHRLLEANDGVEALALAHGETPDLVITDLLMPTMDGFELVRRMRAEPALAQVRVIFYTATYLESDARGLAESCGVRHILTKPAEPEAVLRMVDEVLGVAAAPTAVSRPEDFHTEHLRLLNMTLAHKAEVVVPRLNAIIELSIELASELDPSQLLDTFCAAVRKILGARFAVVSIARKARPEDRQVFSSGLDDASARLLPPSWEAQGRLAQLLTDRRAFRAVPEAWLDLPGLPAARSVLAAAIHSPGTVYGFMCLGEPVAGGGFTEEEEQLASVLGGLVGRIYENGSLYAATRRHAEELERSERRFRQLAENIPEVFFVAEVDPFQIIYISPAYETVWGRSSASLYELSSSWLDSVVPEDLAATTAFLDRALAGEKTNQEYRIQRPDGAVRWLWARTFPVRGNGVRLERIAGIVLDITERKAVSDELRESERRFRGMLANLHLVSLMLDREARIAYCNDYFLDLTGWARDEVLGQDWFQLFVPPEKVELRGAFAALLRDEPQTWHHENEIVTKSGGRRMIRWNNSVLRSSVGEVVGTASIGEDITERKSLDQQLRQSQKMEAVGRLAGGVAHDFNNLLGVIVGYSEGTLRTLAPEHPGRPKIEQVLKATERAASVTRQLLTFSRKQVAVPRVLDLNGIVSEMEKMLRSLIGEDVELVTKGDRGLGRVKADTGEIEQVIMNLAVNARDAMPNGGRLTIETANQELDDEFAREHPGVVPGRYVRIVVSDDGAGIPEDIQPQIFEPFFTTKGVGKGTGLGLSTVYGIVNQSGGHIFFDSEPGRGTSFRIYLPRVDSAADLPHAPLTSIPHGTETILLVEDETVLRDVARETLEEFGYRVIEAANGNAALELAAGYVAHIDLVITDVIMPGLNGRETAARLATLRPGIRILFVSGYTDDAIVRHGILPSDVALLQKPFTGGTLARKVRAVLDDTPPS